MPETVIDLKGIGKKYDMAGMARSLSGLIVSCAKPPRPRREVWALHDVDLSVAKGETVGIIGENASGKTTLLRVISGITVPTRGTVRVSGSVAGLLDVGAGLHPELTGRENIYLDGFLYGMDKGDIEAGFERIVEFSGLRDYLESAVKTYSQGMLVRLGLSVAVHSDPDIFLIDDSLAVGDEEFQRKCLGKITELKGKGKTIIVVSHDLDSISRICERGILLKAGGVIKSGSMHKVITRYIKAVGDKRAIATIDNGRLSVIFNAGKIILLWDGKSLTKNFGGYAGLELPDAWLMSWQAQWSIVESGNGFWKAEGRFGKYNAAITIECRVETERRICWNVRISGDQSLAGKKAGFGFMLSEHYNRFFNGEALEDIAVPAAMQQQWTDVFRSDERNAPMALCADDDLPAVLADFNPGDYTGFGLIQVTDRELDAKVIQMHMKLPGADSSCRDTDAPVQCAAVLELVDYPAFEEFIRERNAAHMIELGPLSVRRYRDGLQVLYDGVVLTKHNNLRFEFSVLGKTFNVFDGQWRLNKENDTSLRIESVFSDMRLNAVLVLSLRPNVLSWDIRVNGDNTTVIEAIGPRIAVTEKYRNYFDEEQEKGFAPASEYAEQVYRSGQKPGFIGLSVDDHALPAIVLTTEAEVVVELRNARFDREERVLLCTAVGSGQVSGVLAMLPTLSDKTAYIAERKSFTPVLGSVGDGRVRLEYDSRRINLFHEQTAVTADEGFCTGVYFQGRWHESRELDREIVRDGNCLKVTIKRRIPGIKEWWRIELDRETVYWSIGFEMPEAIADIHFKAGVLLHPRYEQWAHSFATGNLQQSDSEGAIIELDRDDHALLGAQAPEDGPAVLFEREPLGMPTGIIIRKDNGRCLLQFKFKNPPGLVCEEKQKFFSGLLRLSEKKSWKKDIAEHRSNNFSLNADRAFSLSVGEKKIDLTYNQKSLVGGDGLGVFLKTDQGDVESGHAEWSVKKTGPEKMEISQRWADLPLIQKWEFVRGREAIEWTIKFFVERPVRLQGVFINVVPHVSLVRWMTKEQQGDIGTDRELPASIALFDNRSRGIAFFAREISRAHPGLLFNPTVDMNTWFLHVYRHPRSRLFMCGVNYLIAPDRSVLNPGEHALFRARILPAEDPADMASLIDPVPADEPRAMRSGRFSLVIEKAKIKLFWEGKELTKTLGLYSVFVCGNRWINSSLAKWEVSILPDKTVISLLWNEVEVVQQWELVLLSEHELSWTITTDIRNSGIETTAAVVMLSDIYQEYRTDNCRSGRFPGTFNANDWQVLDSGNDIIKVYAENKLPNIGFRGSASAGEYSNSVENTDAVHAARVLKCQGRVIGGDSRSVFSVRIRLEENS